MYVSFLCLKFSESEISTGVVRGQAGSVHSIGDWISEATGKAIVASLTEVSLRLIDETPQL